jgi:SAM-dependent methyltransferase
VNRAYEENKDNPRVHVVQGNILQMPFRPGVFDHAFSIGVLHHTPDTKLAFESMVKLLKPGGRASIWLYHKWRTPDMQGVAALHGAVKGWITDGLRVITTRLPHPLLHYLCYAAVPVGWVQLKIMNSPKPVKAVLSPLLLVNCSISPDWQVRVCDTFDWYSPQYQWKHTVPEVAGWFRQLGFIDISTQGFPVSVRGTLPAGNSADRSNQSISEQAPVR